MTSLMLLITKRGHVILAYVVVVINLTNSGPLLSQRADWPWPFIIGKISTTYPLCPHQTKEALLPSAHGDVFSLNVGINSIHSPLLFYDSIVFWSCKFVLKWNHTAFHMLLTNDTSSVPSHTCSPMSRHVSLFSRHALIPTM